MGIIDQNNPEYWKRVVTMTIARARHGGLNRDDAEDCAAEVEEIVLKRDDLQDLDAPGALDELRQLIWWHVRTCVHRRNLEARNTVYLAQLAEAARNTAEPVSPEMGPEAIAIKRAEIDAGMRVIRALPERQKWLWLCVEIRGFRIVDIARVTGRSANAVYIEMCAIRKKLRCTLDAGRGQ